MSELIRKPRAKVDRRTVEAAILRLIRYPGSTTMGFVMRMVDEYAASQHTELVYRHAEKVVAQALVDAHQGMESGKKIFLCEVGQECAKKFFSSEDKKFFYKGVAGTGETKIIIEVDHGTTPGTNRVRTIGTKGGTNRVQTIGTKGDTNRAQTDDVSTVDADIDNVLIVDTCIDDVSHVGARNVTDESVTGGNVRELTGDTSTVRVQVDPSDVDMATYEDGKNEPEGVAPDMGAAADGTNTPDRPAADEGNGTLDAPQGDAGEKPCTQCGRTLPLASYGRNRSRPDGHASACRDCEGARDRKRRDALKEAAGGA